MPESIDSFWGFGELCARGMLQAIQIQSMGNMATLMQILRSIGNESFLVKI